MTVLQAQVTNFEMKRIKKRNSLPLLVAVVLQRGVQISRVLLESHTVAMAVVCSSTLLVTSRLLASSDYTWNSPEVCLYETTDTLANGQGFGVGSLVLIY